MKNLKSGESVQYCDASERRQPAHQAITDFAQHKEHRQSDHKVCSRSHNQSVAETTGVKEIKDCGYSRPGFADQSLNLKPKTEPAL